MQSAKREGTEQQHATKAAGISLEAAFSAIWGRECRVGPFLLLPQQIPGAAGQGVTVCHCLLQTAAAHLRGLGNSGARPGDTGESTEGQG